MSKSYFTGGPGDVVGASSLKGKIVGTTRPRTSGDDTADIRDSIGVLVAGGYTGLTDDDARANFVRIASIIGQKEAQDLAVHIFSQNQRPEFKNIPPEQKIGKFYDIRSSHMPTDDILQKVKNFGYGVLPGYQSSVNYTLQKMQGKAGDTVINKTTTIKP